MSAETWRDAEAYAYQRDLSLGGVAWEFLRRNADYRSACVPSPSSAVAATDWGLSFVADPRLDATRQPIFWRPQLYARTVILARSVGVAAAAQVFDPAKWPGRLEERHGADGAHYLLVIGAEEHRLWAPIPLDPGAGLTVLQPLDDHLSIRVEAACRFFRRLCKPAASATPARTDPTARRATQMLRALDAQAAQVSRRVIAEVVLGARCANARQWEDSAERAATARLLRCGADLIAGGYRRLLSRG